MLRDPVEVMYALYFQMCRNGYGEETAKSFEEALGLEEERAKGESIPAHSIFPAGLLYRSVMSFGAQVPRYYDTFPEDQIKVLFSDQLQQSPDAVLSGLLS